MKIHKARLPKGEFRCGTKRSLGKNYKWNWTYIWKQVTCKNCLKIKERTG